MRTGYKRIDASGCRDRICKIRYTCRAKTQRREGYKKKENRRRYGAMMTMEAVIILPLTLMICLLIVWSGILLYNRTAADYALSVAVIQAARQAESENEEITVLAKDKAEELLNSRMVMMEEASLDVRVGIDSVEAVYTGRMRAPVLPSFGDLKSFEWKVEVSRKSPRLKEAMTVRAMKNFGR